MLEKGFGTCWMLVAGALEVTTLLALLGTEWSCSANPSGPSLVVATGVLMLGIDKLANGITRKITSSCNMLGTSRYTRLSSGIYCCIAQMETPTLSQGR